MLLPFNTEMCNFNLQLMANWSIIEAYSVGLKNNQFGPILLLKELRVDEP